MTIAQQLKVKDFTLEIKDIKGKTIYYEFSNGFWFKKEFDAKGNRIYYEDSNGYWEKQEFDANGKTIYYEDSNGTITDNRPKTTLTLDEIAEKFNISIAFPDTFIILSERYL